MSDDQPDASAGDLEHQLAEATARGDHFARLLAALVAASGPVQISASAYAAADPSALLDLPAIVGGEQAIMYALPEQVIAFVGRFASPPAAGDADAS